MTGGDWRDALTMASTGPALTASAAVCRGGSAAGSGDRTERNTIAAIPIPRMAATRTSLRDMKTTNAERRTYYRSKFSVQRFFSVERSALPIEADAEPDASRLGKRDALPQVV